MPGIIVWPRRSIVSTPGGSGTCGPTAAMVVPSTRTVAPLVGSPTLPSMSVPFVSAKGGTDEVYRNGPGEAGLWRLRYGTSSIRSDFQRGDAQMRQLFPRGFGLAIVLMVTLAACAPAA